MTSTLSTGQEAAKARAAARAEQIRLMTIRLEAYGLPDPLDPTRVSALYAHDWSYALNDLRRAKMAQEAVEAGNKDAASALAEFCNRVEIVHTLQVESMDERYDDYVVECGEGDDYQWNIYGIDWPRGDNFCMVSWWDGIAQWEIQLVKDIDAAHEFLRALEAVVKRGESLSDYWADDLPTVDCTGWSVTTQVTVDIELNPDGTPCKIDGQVFFDPDFIIAVKGPDGVDVFLDSDDIPDAAAAVIDAVEGGTVS